MTEWVAFGAGVFIGGAVGVVLMCLLALNGPDFPRTPVDDEDIQK